VDVRVRGRAGAAEVRVGDGEPMACSLRADGSRVAGDADELVLSYQGATQRYASAATGGGRWLGRRGRSWSLTETDTLTAAHADTGQAGGGEVRSPMPGTVLSVVVAQDDVVRARQPLLIIEAMKMEFTVSAPIDGVIGELSVRAGDQVAVDQPLLTVLPPDSGG
jgi:acetyl-CoA/propionyl-CoA carboxylase biotin carboxyl carrier protein